MCDYVTGTAMGKRDIKNKNSGYRSVTSTHLFFIQCLDIIAVTIANLNCALARLSIDMGSLCKGYSQPCLILQLRGCEQHVFEVIKRIVSIVLIELNDYNNSRGSVIRLKRVALFYSLCNKDR